MINEDVDTVMPPKHSGIHTIAEGEVSYVWAVYSRPIETLGFTDTQLLKFGRQLTGWQPFTNGPGRAFGDQASVRASKSRILVVQRIGLDI